MRILRVRRSGIVRTKNNHGWSFDMNAPGQNLEPSVSLGGRLKLPAISWAAINQREVALKSIAGLIGGLIAWIPVEMWFAAHADGVLYPGTRAAHLYYLAQMFFPALVGVLINATDVSDFTTSKAKRFLAITFVVCFILGLPAAYYSEAVFIYMTGTAQAFKSEVLAFRMFARGVSFILFGLVAGAGVGLATGSRENLFKGAIGGAIGGFFGGLLFDPISGLTSAGALARITTWGELGLLIGLMIGLVQNLTKTAWLTVEAGRLRHREFRLERAVTALGRAEECDIGLFGDPAVEPRHAVIEHKGDDFVLNALGHTVTVNGRPARGAKLRGGDRIGIGNYELSFNLREVPASASAERSASVSPSAPRSYPRFIDASGHELMLRADAPTTIGRSQDNDIVLTDGSVSRRHAVLHLSEGGYFINDLQSQNGLYLNGLRIFTLTDGSQGHRLSDGDIVRLGDVELTFRL
jgi:pSer/pThr/pTyr-binding forkhead associated (FHA) protein